MHEEGPAWAQPPPPRGALRSPLPVSAAHVEVTRLPGGSSEVVPTRLADANAPWKLRFGQRGQWVRLARTIGSVAVANARAARSLSSSDRHRRSTLDPNRYLVTSAAEQRNRSDNRS